MQVELKNIEIFESGSQETTCFTADLWIDGKKAATVENSGNGGANLCRFYDQQLHRQFEEYCRSLPSDYEWPMDEDFFITLLVAKHQEEQALKKACRKKILFRLKSKTYDIGEWESVRQAYSPEAAAGLRVMYGDDLGEIANERFLFSRGRPMSEAAAP